MSTKGTAGKSASGASMSKYDVEVEARLQALEAQANSGGGADVAALAARLEEVVAALKMAAPGSTKHL